MYIILVIFYYGLLEYNEGTTILGGTDYVNKSIRGENINLVNSATRYEEQRKSISRSATASVQYHCQLRFNLSSFSSSESHNHCDFLATTNDIGIFNIVVTRKGKCANIKHIDNDMCLINIFDESSSRTPVSKSLLTWP